ncbi:MAG: helix-turn-helix domain-containing protein [Bacteroidota bacterium]
MLTDNQIIRFILAFKVRSLRLEKGFSYQNLSDATGLSTSYLSDIEKGKRYPKPDKINQLAKALDVDYNYLVGTNTSKKLKPVIDLITSNFFKLFPLKEFGINMEMVVELFSQTPDRVNAFISTFFKIARNYQIDEQEFHLEALRSYQNLHNNHFPELENAAAAFKTEFSIDPAQPLSPEFLEEQLLELYDIQINRTALSSNQSLLKLRSFYNPTSKTLYLAQNLSAPQESFLIARELGFHFLKLKKRPYETTIIDIKSFEVLWNNYKASHFAAALLMDAQSLSQDLLSIFRQNTWNPTSLIDLLDKYNVSTEMLLQRLTNILPHHFGLEDLFFIKLEGDSDLKRLRMSKDLHLSQLHNPYNNLLEEHFCRRWVACKSIQDRVKEDSPSVIANVQISDFWESDKSYLCFSLASKSTSSKSVTLGLLINEKLRSIIYFLNDPKVLKRTVNTTCQRCAVPNCQERVSEPVFIIQEEKRKQMIRELNELL